MERHINKLLVSVAIITMLGCSSKKKDNPTPVFTPDKTLLPGARWNTLTIVFTEYDGTVTTKHYATSDDAPILLNDVTFFANGTAKESDYADVISWTVNGANFDAVFLTASGTPEGDEVKATITALDQHNLTLEMDNYNGFAGVHKKVVQELTR